MRCSTRGYYTEAGKIVNQARGMGIKQPIAGGDGFSDAKFVAQATPAAATKYLLRSWILY